MEATATVPGQPGTTEHHSSAGERIHQLLGLAEALVRTSLPEPTGQEERALVASPLGVNLASLTDEQAVAWAQNLEHLNRHLQGLLVQAAGELSDRVYAGRYEEACSRKPTELLTSSLKLSRDEAARRLRLANHFFPSTDPLAPANPTPSQPVLGSALFTGRISATQALIISGYVDEASRLAKSGRIPEETPRDLEELLSRQAEDVPPDNLRVLGKHALTLLDPDGHKPSEADLIAKQGIFFRKPRKGLIHLDGYMTIRQYEHLMAGIGWSTSPKHQDTTQDNAQKDAAQKDAAQEDTGQEDAGQGDAGWGVMDQSCLFEYLLAPASPDHAPQHPQESFVQHPLQPLWTPATGDNGSTWLKPPPTPHRDATAQGWRKPLAPEDLPPRPPHAPPHAIPPRFEGEKWFWFRDTLDSTATDNGWINSPPHNTHIPGPPEPSPWATTITEPEPAPAQPWPHLINGVPVPEPGQDCGLGGMDPIDPLSTDPAIKDRRTHAQKLLDGLISCVMLAARTNQLPLNGGLKSQLYLSLTQQDLEKKDGTAAIVVAPYSGPVPLSLFDQDLCTCEITPMLRDSNGSILDVGRTQRLFTFAQRKILLARDLGCTFPDCTAPPFWTEAHHIIAWQNGGATSVDNSVLCCSLHHHYLHNRGWTVRLDGNTAWFTPPYTTDILRRERRNLYHHHQT